MQILVGLELAERNNYANNSQRNDLCYCNCNLAAKIIPITIVYLIVIDAFVQWEQSHTHIWSLSTIFYVIVIVTWQEKFAEYVFVCI